MAQLTGLNNKVAVITGGSQGLGAATAHLFAERGAKGLVLCVNLAPIAIILSDYNKKTEIGGFLTMHDLFQSYRKSRGKRHPGSSFLSRINFQGVVYLVISYTPVRLK